MKYHAVPHYFSILAEQKKPYSMKEAIDYLGWLGDRNALPAMGHRE
jgi:hypothetical protein